MPALPPLDDIHVDLLMVIWRDYWQSGDAEKGLPRSELAERLRGEYLERWRKEYNIPAEMLSRLPEINGELPEAARKALAAIPALDTIDGRCWLLTQLPKLIEVVQGRSRGGRRENNFRLVEKTGAGLPSSARLLLEVARVRVIPVAMLVERLESSRLSDRPGYPELTRDDLLERVGWAVKTARYLQAVHGNNVAPEPLRLDYEIRFIERVAGYCLEGGKLSSENS